MSVHGGEVWQVASELGISASDVLDFSANINPRGLPLRARERLAQCASDPNLLRLYPDPSARVLRAALSETLGVAFESILIGPGSEALLYPILHAHRPTKALIPVPAFAEYRRVCEQLKVEVIPYQLERSRCFRPSVLDLCGAIAAERAPFVFLNNPHNPSGSLLSADEARRIADAGAAVVVDEAFIDYTPDASLTADASRRPGLIVLRSLTKFYGCPALRVGYLVAHPDEVRRIAAFLPVWPVTQFALDTCVEALADAEHASLSRSENTKRREALAIALQSLGLNVFPSAANYLLVELGADMPRASELRALMLRAHHILIRNCDSFEGLTPGRYIRLAIRDEADNGRLVEALSEVLG
jgi:threonine-phosphate decarboxylase